MRTQSIISDQELTVPALTGKAKEEEKAIPTDYEKIANGTSYPQFRHYIEGRIEHFQQFTPGNTPIQEISKEDQVQAWDSAVTIIQEFEGILNTLEAFKKKK